jgi:MYXO-CTERM domain-containing protein
MRRLPAVAVPLAILSLALLATPARADSGQDMALPVDNHGCVPSPDDLGPACPEDMARPPSPSPSVDGLVPVDEGAQVYIAAHESGCSIAPRGGAPAWASFAAFALGASLLRRRRR